MSARVVDDRTIDLICQWRRNGFTLRFIADRFGVDLGVVRYWCVAKKAAGPRESWREEAGECRRSVAQGRIRTIVPFTEREDAELVRLHSLGISNTDIGRRLGRDPAVIRDWLVRKNFYETRQIAG